MKDEILKLRSEGKTYKEIVEILCCAKSTVAYYCGENQKGKARKRSKKRRAEIPIARKIESFKARRRLRCRVEKFQCRESGSPTVYDNKKISFGVKEVLAKIGDNPTCYLTGEKIDLNESSTYQLDHVIPVSKGGDNSLNNLGLLSSRINKAKSDFTIEEFLNICKDVLQNNGFLVIKKE